MKRLPLIFLLLGSTITSSSSQVTEGVLQAIDRQVTFESDVSGEYNVVHERPGEPKSTQTLAVFRRDADDKFLILILRPEADKGKGYLKVGNNLWFYDPIGRRFTVTSAKDRFQDSNARNSDFSRSNFAADYKVVSSTLATLGKFSTQLLELQASHDNVLFPKTRLWVTSDNLVRKSEDYSLSGQLLRTVAIPQYQKVGTKWVPTTVVIIDNLKGKAIAGVIKYETTTLGITKPSSAMLPDLMFTQGYLEKVSK